jgi:hypothetical protein
VGCAIAGHIPPHQLYFCVAGPVAIPPTLLVTVIERTAGDTVKDRVYLPPRPGVRAPIRGPVPAFHTVREAAVVVLVASTLNWKERTVFSAFVIRTESRGRRIVTPAVRVTPAIEAEIETAASAETVEA